MTNPFKFIFSKRAEENLNTPLTIKAEPIIETQTPITQQRMFNGANMGRLQNDQLYSVININDEIRTSLRVLLSRSRQLSKDDSYFRSYLAKSERNILGPNGITLRMRITDASGNPDDAANHEIENAWEDWGRGPSVMADWSDPFCVDAVQTWIDFQRLVVRTWKTDGSCIIRRFKGFRDNPYAYAVQVLDSNSLDFWYNQEIDYSHENRIIMGVEINEYGRPVAYWFRPNRMETPPNANVQAQNTDRIRIPANEITHIFTQEYPGQVRGFPSCASSILNLNMLRGYSEGELVAARMSAEKMGFYKTDTGVEYEGDERMNGQILENFEPGKISVMPKGVEFKEVNPTHPNGNYGNFVKAQLREVAAGLGMSYHSISGDLESVNYSSMRSGTIEERDGWKLDQSLLVEKLCIPIFNEWLFCFLALSGKTKLPAAKYSKFKQATFKPRQFMWVDPRNDASASISLMQAGLKTPQSLADEMGFDVYENIDEIAHLMEYAKKKGVPLNILNVPQAPQVVDEEGKPLSEGDNNEA